MDLFEFHIMEKIRLMLSTLNAKDAIPVNIGAVTNYESDKRIEYLFNKFENEDGNLWRFCKKTVQVLYGRKIDRERESFYAICDTAYRYVLNRELPDGYNLYKEISRYGIEWTARNINKKLIKFAVERLGYGESPKDRMYYFPVNGFLKMRLPLKEAVELTPLFEKLDAKDSEHFKGIEVNGLSDSASVKYMFDYINELDKAEETLKMDLIMPFNEHFAINVKDSEVAIKKMNSKVILTDEMEAYEFLRTFKQRISYKKQREYKIEQKDYKAFVLSNFNYSFEKSFYEIDPIYLEEMADYMPDLSITITDGEKKIEISKFSKSIFLSAPRELRGDIEDLGNKIKERNYFKEVFMKTEKNEKFVPIENFRQMPEYFKKKKEEMERETLMF